MVDNKGSAYRTKGAILTAFVIVAAAVALLCAEFTDVDALGIIGLFVLIAGIGITAISFAYSGEPDKFGPSESDYRLAAGTMVALAGLVMLMLSFETSAVITAAVLLIGIAAVGTTMAFRNGGKSK